MSRSLGELPVGAAGTIVAVGGVRPFRRRLMEMGLVPGTKVKLVSVAPLGDPLELELRGSRISLRRREAAEVSIDG